MPNINGPVATVGDLIAKLQNLDPSMPVYAPAENYESDGLIPAWLEHYGKDQPAVKEFIVISHGPEGLAN